MIRIPEQVGYQILLPRAEGVEFSSLQPMALAARVGPGSPPALNEHGVAAKVARIECREITFRGNLGMPRAERASLPPRAALFAFRGPHELRSRSGKPEPPQALLVRLGDAGRSPRVRAVLPPGYAVNRQDLIQTTSTTVRVVRCCRMRASLKFLCRYTLDSPESLKSRSNLRTSKRRWSRVARMA